MRSDKIEIVVAASTGVRIGLGCAAAAWGSVMIGGACGDGPGEVASYTVLERALCEKLIECRCGEAFAAIDLQLPLSCDGWSLADVFGYGEEGDYYGYGYEGGYEGGGYDEQLPQSVDEECVQQIARQIEALDCSLVFTPGGTDCHDFCWPVIGPRFEGEPCESQTECGRNLVCDRGECTDPCLVRPPAEGDACRSGNDCPEATVCAIASEDADGGICIALPSEGQACYFGECASGLRCDNGPEESVCVALVREGEPCMGHLECASQYCPAGRCAQAPGGNQPCGASNACGPGTMCIDEGDGAICVPFASECAALLDDVLELYPIVTVNGG